MWQYFQPVKVIFGTDSIDRMAEAIVSTGGTKGLLVTSPSFVKNGTADRLAKLSENKISDIFSDVTPNPDVRECDACIELLRRGGHDFVVALGGGSVMDCAKAASALCKGPSELTATDYLQGRAEIPPAHLPLIAVPTTSGTGSEVTSVAVLSDYSIGLKAPISAESLYPAIGIVDPRLTLTTPPKLTAATGMDALCHSIEAYWSRHHQPVCDALAIHAARLILDNLATAVANPDDIKAREAMAEASTIAGMSFAIPKTSAPHACSYPLTNQLGIAHGEACGLTLSHFLRFNTAHGCDRINALATSLGYDSAEHLAAAIDTLAATIGLRRDLADLALSPEQIEALVQGSKHPNLRNNPADISENDLREMYLSLSNSTVD